MVREIPGDVEGSDSSIGLSERKVEGEIWGYAWAGGRHTVAIVKIAVTIRLQ